MAETITNAITDMLYDFLHLTMQPDASSVRRIEAEAYAGMALLKVLCDPDMTFESGTEGGKLLCEYVLRAESGAAATFEEDFAADILRLKVSNDIQGYAEAMGYVVSE